ncbi:MAG: CocE/NonD family hydrolase [Prochloraceae cyanobacterium]|nr:CocE/NonD family hydrolase [Prochloraceae cyanobacterium]
MFEVKKETASMQTRDGVRLDADIYRPDNSQELPVLLMRQPYGRAIASTVVYAHPSWYAARGYIVVIQDVRGRGTSQGEFKLFDREIEDGLDSVNWASQLPGSTGKVGMYGFSYQGMTQLYAAVAKPSALKVICPAMIAYDLYEDWAYEGGAFCLQANLGWAIQLAAETARLRGEENSYQQLYAAARNLPLYDRIPANPRILKELGPDSFYHDWLARPHPDEYWEKLSPKYLMQDVDLPVLHVGGWFDPYLRGTLNLYKHMEANSKLPQHLIVGPWAHLPWGRKVGAKDYGSEATSPVDRIQLRWFDRFLKGKDTGITEEKPVCLFEMGSNRWRYFNAFPRGDRKSYYLKSNGNASISDSDGILLEGGYGNENTISSPDVLVHDPWRPVPAFGGHASIPAGSLDRSNIDCRADVLTYTSAPLEENLHVAGDVAVEIYCRCDAPSFDLCAVLSEVFPDGRAYNFTQGYLYCSPEEVNNKKSVKIGLQATCKRIDRGNSLRLSLSAAYFPAYPINPGTGTIPTRAKTIDAKIITLTVGSRCDFPSHVQLSVLTFSPG